MRVGCGKFATLQMVHDRTKVVIE